MRKKANTKQNQDAHRSICMLQDDGILSLSHTSIEMLFCGGAKCGMNQTSLIYCILYAIYIYTHIIHIICPSKGSCHLQHCCNSSLCHARTDIQTWAVYERHGLRINWGHDLSEGTRQTAPGWVYPQGTLQVYPTNRMLSLCSDNPIGFRVQSSLKRTQHFLWPFKKQTSPLSMWNSTEVYQESFLGSRSALGNRWTAPSPRNLMQQPPKGGNSDVLHVQYWMVGTFKIKDPGGAPQRKIGCLRSTNNHKKFQGRVSKSYCFGVTKMGAWLNTHDVWSLFLRVNGWVSGWGDTMPSDLRLLGIEPCRRVDNLQAKKLAMLRRCVETATVEWLLEKTHHTASTCHLH